MHAHIEKLYQISNKQTRLAIGLMSGTSLDGLDVALCEISGAGQETDIRLVEFRTVDYSDDDKQRIRKVFSRKTVDLQTLCVLNPWIGQRHAAMILECLQAWGVSAESVDFIASHGQTVYHAPQSLHGLADWPNATLQLGDADHMAVSTGIITIGDFRQKHIAAGGEGAPLAVYGDYLIFSSPDENRIMLNLGGIANLTYLPGSMDASKVFSSDVGTGNTLMDAYVQANFNGLAYDKGAAIAREGTVSPRLLDALKDHSFFSEPMPKTTGPELLNLAYLEAAQEKSVTKGLSGEDIMATLNRFSADMIVDAILQHAEGLSGLVIYASGGGAHNPLLMQNIREQLPEFPVKTTADLGIDPDAKEAVLFALLGNETLCGQRAGFGNAREGIPSITMGKISFYD